MALLTVHLLAAQRWAEGHAEFLTCPDFYLGAISPDAIHVRDHEDKSHKNETHLNNWLTPRPDDVIAYWRKRHAPFDIGYGIHSLTDAQWAPRYRALLPQIIKPDGRVNVEIYYRDAFVTDYALYRDAGGEALFDLVAAGVPPEDHPLLTQEELAEWQRMMVDSYHKPCPRQDAAEYIDRAYVDSFLNDCQDLFEETYRRFLYE